MSAKALSSKRIYTEAPQFAAQLMDLIGGSILRGTLAVFGELRTVERSIALGRQICDTTSRLGRINRRRRRGRGTQQPIHALRAGTNAVAGHEFSADCHARWGTMGPPQLGNDCSNFGIGELRRSGHLRRLR
jgi:hypothetical protein